MLAFWLAPHEEGAKNTKKWRAIKILPNGIFRHRSSTLRQHSLVGSLDGSDDQTASAARSASQEGTANCVLSERTS